MRLGRTGRDTAEGDGRPSGVRSFSGVMGVGVNAVSEFLRSIGTTRLVAGIAILSLIGGALAAAMIRLADKDMTVLFTDLDLRDAARITEDLRGRDVPYEQRHNGTTILVPSDQVLDLRMVFASEGLPARGIVGYELLDNQSALGTTSFLQNINYVRALEGELARTIAALDSVRNARVFLNLPKRELFSRETKPATASIQLETTHGSLTRNQVRGIQFLVASAVQGLVPQRVSVIDEQGNVLASGQGDGPDAIAGSLDERRLGLERQLQNEVQEILTRIVGPQNARVRVTAEMSYNRVVEETRSFDPERQVTVSTRTVEQNASSDDRERDRTVSVANNLPDGGQDGDGNQSSSRENRVEETTNFENSLTKRTEVQEAGRLERLSVAVLVNEARSVGADGAVTFTPRTDQELRNIEELVRAAVGFDESRGDQIRVISSRFAEPERPEAFEPDGGLMADLDINRVIESIALVILALIFLLALQPLIKRLMTPRTQVFAESVGALEGAEGAGGLPQLPGPDTPALPSGEGGAPGTALAQAGEAGQAGDSSVTQAIDFAQIQGQVKESSVKKVGEIIHAHPEESMSILRSWLHEKQ